MINWARVKELEQDIGPDDIEEVIELFLTEVEEVMRRLTTEGAAAGLEENMHFLKGSALNLGFDQLGQMCSEAERKAASGDGHEVSVDAVLSSYEQSKTVFLEGMAEHRQPA